MGGSPFGVGFYRILSWVNHSCNPNCEIFFDGTIARMIVSNINGVKEGE